VQADRILDVKQFFPARFVNLSFALFHNFPANYAARWKNYIKNVIFYIIFHVFSTILPFRILTSHFSLIIILLLNYVDALTR
jgi:hypothetical protein